MGDGRGEILGDLGADADEFKVKRQEVFEFSQKPTVTREGDKVTIAIRPERLNFASVEKKTNLLDATIDNITFLGSIVRIQFSIGANRLYMDTFNNPFLELPKIGTKDQITCSQEAVLILKA